MHDAFWSADSRAVYYSLKRSGSPVSDLHRIDLQGGNAAVLDGAAIATSDAEGIFDSAGTRSAFARNGDVFVRDLRSGTLSQITRGTQVHATPHFSADGRSVSYRQGQDWFVHDLVSGVDGSPLRSSSSKKIPMSRRSPTTCATCRCALLPRCASCMTTRKPRQARRRIAQVRSEPRAAAFYLGEDIKVLDTELSPDARWMLVVTGPKTEDKGREGKLTRYVTESGYEEFETERVRVGRNPPAGQNLLLLDLAAHSSQPLAFDGLPGIHDDPLKAVREEKREVLAAHQATPNPPRIPVRKGRREVRGNGKSSAAKTEDKPKARALRIVSNAEDGAVAASSGAAMVVRWRSSCARSTTRIAGSCRSISRGMRSCRSTASATWPGSAGNSTNSAGSRQPHAVVRIGRIRPCALVYTGTRRQSARIDARCVRGVAAGPVDRWSLVLRCAATPSAPYSYDVYRVGVDGGKLERVTQYQGVEGFALSHDDKQLLVSHSSSYVPTQIAANQCGWFGHTARVDRYAHSRFQSADVAGAGDRAGAVHAFQRCDLREIV